MYVDMDIYIIYVYIYIYKDTYCSYYTSGAVQRTGMSPPLDM